MCTAFGRFRAAVHEIEVDEPLPADGTLEQLRDALLQRLDRVLPMYDQLRQRLSQLPAAAGAEPLREALDVWVRDAEGLDLAFQSNVRGAASVDVLRTVHADWDSSSTRALFLLHASVARVSDGIRSALAVYEGDCDELHVEAAGLPTGYETPSFDTERIEDGFDAVPVWYADSFIGGRAEQTGDEYRVTITEAGSGWWVNTHLTHTPAVFGDVRIQTSLSIGGPADEFTFTEGGLICRDSGSEAPAAYVVVVRSYGVDPRAGAAVLVWKKDPDYRLVARRTLLEIDVREVALALACVGGGDESPVTLVVDVDGDRALEWSDRAPLAPQGFVGMIASSASPAVVSFRDIRVVTP